MRHATDSALDRLEGLLGEIRKRHAALRERKRGAFYRGGQGWLHFHEDSAGLFADLKIGGGFTRFRVSTKAEQGTLLRKLRNSLAAK
jgi:DNA-binding transcriptional MocR family regulator